MIRAAIAVSGDVQEAGYRACVMKIARKLGLVGYTENILDGTVKIICEGKKENIEKFIETIKMKTETINVEDVKVSYENATGEFEGKGFAVRISDLGQELFQGFNTAVKCFKIGWDKQDETLKAIKDMHQDTNKRFDLMAKRYDLIAEGLTEGLAKIDKGFARMEKEFIRSRKEIAEEFRKSRKETAEEFRKSRKETAEEFRKSRKEIAEEFRKSRSESAKAYDNLARAINNLAKSLKIRKK